MKIILIMLALVSMANASDDGDTAFRRQNCTVTPHTHYYKHLLPDTVKLNPKPRPVGYPHCWLRTWGEYQSTSGRCMFDDIMTGWINGAVLCSRVNVICQTDRMINFFGIGR
jgi:hypothetical protein